MHTVLHLETLWRRLKGQVHVHNAINTSKPCRDGKGVKRQVKDVTGSRNPNPACRRFRILVIWCWPQITASPGSTLNKQGTALLAPQGEGPRKGGLSEACLSSLSWLAAVNSISSVPKTLKQGRYTPTSKSAKILKVACWNIRTMLDAVHSNRPECRSAPIAHELSRLNVNIAVLSKVHFPGKGSLQGHGARNTLFWSRKPTTEGCLSGIDFMISTSIASKLENLSTGHSDCMMSMCLPLKNKRYATLFSVYAPTLWAESTDKNKFYSELHSCLQSIPADDKVIILGDFNARVSQDANSWKGVLDRYSVGNCNNNMHLLLELCTEQ